MASPNVDFLERGIGELSEAIGRLDHEPVVGQVQLDRERSLSHIDAARVEKDGLCEVLDHPRAQSGRVRDCLHP